MGKQKINIYTKLINNSLLSFALSFIVIIIFFILINNLFLSELYTNMMVKQGQEYFHSNINTQYQLKREVRLQRDIKKPDEIIISTIFYDKKNQDGTLPNKNISINIIYEGLLPILLVIALTLSVPTNWKRKLISSLIALVLINLYVYFKLYCFAYDNYSAPDFALKSLPFLVDKIVYAYNYFISLSGYSSNLVIAVIVFTISSVRIKDLEQISEHFQNISN
ncbi:MAG TPA: hypothetical protein PLE30_11100 [Candidatus Kapabacteria bacterium]|nr:hypothetical protein [Candidatus Kapabacteria bacterium]